MEKVQFHLEGTLPELKDLHEKGLFTKHEINQITRKRTGFETSLIRRETRKDDFFKYAEYEINLERLRKVRWRKLNYHINPPPHSASTYSLPRRAIYILKRATSKFPGDLAVWLAYIEYASKQGMRKIVLKGLNSALQHHPLSPTLYLLLSYHHLHPNSPFPRDIIPTTSTSDLPSAAKSDTGFSIDGTSAARTTILLGLRLVPKSPELWTEYIKLELGWVEALRRRWNVLGINEASASTGDAAGPDAMTGGEGSFGPEGEDARKSILSGQLVIHALKSALQAITLDLHGGIDFRKTLLAMLRTYPSALRQKCLDEVYLDLGSASGSSRAAAEAKLTGLTRRLYDRAYEPGEEIASGTALDGVDLVEELGRIGKEIRKSAKGADSEWLDVCGCWLGDQLEQLEDGNDLREYLISIIASLTSAKYHPPASLLLLHLDILRSSMVEGEKMLSTARAHASQYPSDPAIQRIRLNSEAQHADPSTVRDIATAIVKSVGANGIRDEDEIAVRDIWFTWSMFEEQAAENIQSNGDSAWAVILPLSARLNRSSTHAALLGRYFISTLQSKQPQPPLATIRGFVKYRPSPEFYAIAFAAIAVYSSSPQQDLQQLYELWRSAARIPEDKLQAGLAWATWLLDNGKALEATRVADTLTRGGDGEAETRWKAILDATEVRQSRLRFDDQKIELEYKLAELDQRGLSTPGGVLEEEGDESEDDEMSEDDEESRQGEDGEDSDEEMDVTA